MDKTRNSLAEEWQMVKSGNASFKDDWKVENSQIYNFSYP